MSKLILARDKNGVFLEIPEDQAKKFIVADDQIEEAQAFYESEVEGQRDSGWKKGHDGCRGPRVLPD